MSLRRKITQSFRPVRRETAERYVFVTLLSFAASVSVTRLFLTLTGYPQLGGGELHIAHVLWGGLLLFAAALLPLVLANRWVYSTGALLAGVGVGLFIDEVGKFITQRNDYFFPAAAPIVYTLFLLTILLLLHVRSMPDASPHTDLHRALGDIREMLEHPLKHAQRLRLLSHLERIAQGPSSPGHADLARSLMRFVDSEQSELALSPAAPPSRSGLQDPQAVARHLPMPRLRFLLVIGLAVVALLTLKNPIHALVGQWLPVEFNDLLGRLYAGRQIDPATAPFWFGVRISLEIVVGSVFVVSASLMAVGRTDRGSTLGIAALVLSLTTINLLLFYFEQFSTVITTGIQFLLLLGLLFWRSRLRAKQV